MTLMQCNMGCHLVMKYLISLTAWRPSSSNPKLCTSHAAHLKMLSGQISSFLKPRYFSDEPFLPAKEPNAPPYNLITFLAVVQKLKICFLQVSWQAVRQTIGVGATGRINQALINLYTSFAFKCVSDREKENKAEGLIYRDRSPVDPATPQRH